MVPNPTLLRLIKRNRTKGQKPADARANAKKTFEKFQDLKKQKKELGLSSTEAWHGTEELTKFRDVQKQMHKINPKLKISIAEAANLFQIWNDTLVNKHFTLSNFLKDYAQTRSRSKKVEFTTYRPVAETILRNLERSGQFSVHEMKKFSESLFDIATAAQDIRPTFQSYPALTFMRFWREGSLHSLKTQRWLLEQHFITDLRVGAVEPKAQAMVEFVKRKVRGLKGPVSQALMNQIRKKDPKFNKRPVAVRKKIIMEARTNQLGNQIAKRIVADTQHELGLDPIAFLTDGAASGKKQKYSIDADNPYKVGDAPYQFEPYYNTWIVQMLARPGNRKFLAQKAIEWFSKAR
jgi:hypothetical protein